MDKTNERRHRPQDDIPYEIIVKHVIEDYRKLAKANDDISKYARLLEQEIEDVKDKAFMYRREVKNNAYKKVYEKGLRNMKLTYDIKSYKDRIKALKKEVLQLKKMINTLKKENFFDLQNKFNEEDDEL